MSKINTVLRVATACLMLGAALLLWSLQSAAAADATGASTPQAVLAAPAKTDAPATLRILNRELMTMRASVGGITPEVRVQRTRERIRALPDAAMDQPVKVVPVTIGDARGVYLMIGDNVLFAVLEGDVDHEAGESFDALVEQTQTRVEEARAAWHQLRDRPLLFKGLLSAAGATLLLGLLIWVVYRGSRKAVEWLEKKRDALAARHSYVDWREFLARLAVGTAQLAQWFILIALVYAWLGFVLDSFIATKPIAQALGDWTWGRLAWVADGMLSSVPGLVTVVIVLVITRMVIDLLGYFFEAVRKGRLHLPMFHPETTFATRRIFTVIIWGLGIAVAYPYLPGSNSEAFKGLSVLFGLMITLGSAGLVTQAMSGLVVVYSRALHKGDFVDVNGVQGVVTEVASLATKIVNVRNEEITIPNAVLISSPIRNYSKLAGSQGTLLTTVVTIGYDAPWRQVHAMLIGAAQKTPGVRATPTPYVYQRALSDFYVEYELFVSIDKAMDRIPTLSALHESIQDVFNEHGVQIMSPHFLSQPDKAVVVPKAHWFAAPAKPADDGRS